MAELNRREFVVLTAACAAAGACMMCGADFAKANPPSSAVDVGPISDYAKDGVSDKFAESDRILVARENGKIYAMSAKCTHKGATVRLKNGKLICPKHGSHFDDEGKPTSGPASHQGVPLFRYPISKNDTGHLIVDTTKTLGQKQWDQSNASLSVG